MSLQMAVGIGRDVPATAAYAHEMLHYSGATSQDVA